MKSIRLSTIIALLMLCSGCGVSKKTFELYQTEIKNTLSTVNQQVGEIKKNQADMLNSLNNVKSKQLQDEEVTKRNISDLTSQITSVKDKISVLNESKDSIEKIIENIVTSQNNKTDNSSATKGTLINGINVGQHFTDFELPAPQGDMLKLSDLVGQTDYLLIDFWASWCGPCIRSFTGLKSVYEKYHGNRFEILGISRDRNENDWQEAITKHNLSWKHVFDYYGRVTQIYNVSGIPCTILIDKNGKIVGRNLYITEIEDILIKN